MNKVIEDIRKELAEYGLDLTSDSGDCTLQLTWLGEMFVKGDMPKDSFAPKIMEKINKLDFKFIEKSENDDGDGGYSIISIKGQLYKLKYEYGSYEEISGYNEFWDWQPVTATTKTVKSYE